MLDSYRPKNRNTAEKPRSSDRRHRKQSSRRRGYHSLARDRSRSPSARPWYEGSYYRPSPERRPQEQRTTTTVTVTTITATSTSRHAAQFIHTMDEPRDMPRRPTIYGREDEAKGPRSPRDNGNRRGGPRLHQSRSRSPLRASETHRRRSRSRSPGRYRDSYQGTGGQDRASLANPARTIKTAEIDYGRRNGLRTGGILPRDDKERRWVAYQLRLQDLDAGRVEPISMAEVNIVRRRRVSARMKPTQENKSIYDSDQSMKLKKPET